MFRDVFESAKELISENGYRAIGAIVEGYAESLINKYVIKLLPDNIKNMIDERVRKLITAGLCIVAYDMVEDERLKQIIEGIFIASVESLGKLMLQL